MLIDDVLAAGVLKKKYDDMPDAMAFEVTAIWRALPEDGWQEEVERLADTTPSFPPYLDSWWEWHVAGGGDQGALVSVRDIQGLRAAARDGMFGSEPDSHLMEESISLGAVGYGIGFGVVRFMGRFGTLGAFVIPWDERGMLIRRPGASGYLIGVSPDARVAAISGTERAQALLRDFAWQLLYMTSLLHVRNIIVDSHAPSEKMQRARKRRGKLPLVTYHTLSVQVGAVKQRGDRSQRGETLGVMPLHLVRGNFAHYSDAAPLFGRYSGTFWRPAHVKGNAARGAVVKDYAIDI